MFGILLEAITGGHGSILLQKLKDNGKISSDNHTRTIRNQLPTHFPISPGFAFPTSLLYKGYFEMFHQKTQDHQNKAIFQK